MINANHVIVPQTFRRIDPSVEQPAEPAVITNRDTEAWLHEHITAETEGERTPAQGIEIRADFARKAFCLYRNGEAVGASSQYKAVYFARQFLLAELAQVRS